MKLSTRSRYGTRLILDLARHADRGPVQLGEIAQRQNISVKYLEQIIRPLKQARYIRSVRGPKGGHVLSRAPENITVGEIVALLEGGKELIPCAGHPEDCPRSDNCATRFVWREAAKALFERLNTISFNDLLHMSSDGLCD